MAQCGSFFNQVKKLWKVVRLWLPMAYSSGFLSMLFTGCTICPVCHLANFIFVKTKWWQNSVVSVGAFIAGNAGNVVPQTALLRLSIRNMEPKLREMVLIKIRSITKSQAEAFGCKYEIREGEVKTLLLCCKRKMELIACWVMEITLWLIIHNMYSIKTFCPLEQLIGLHWLRNILNKQFPIPYWSRGLENNISN